MVISGIENYYDQYNIPPKIYALGAEAYKQMIDKYPHVDNIPKYYMKMAEWYWKANEKENAVRCQKKLLKLLRKRKDFYLHEMY